jgi:phosphoglycolate phosphatase-like HAD superfamily hydrolase
MPEVSHVVLFDIDGTLIHSARAGFRGMNAAFQSLYGVWGALDRVSLAGRTDRAIVCEVLNGLGREPTDEAVLALRELYLEHLADEMSRPVPGAVVLPGVGAILDALEARDDVAVGLLTGNFERGAAIKLGYFQLWSRFAFGAFGDLHVNRRDLVPVARAHADRLHGASIPASNVTVIGDTPLDVDCAHAHGARSIAVATGPFSGADLAHAGAGLVLDTLEDVDAVLMFLRGEKPAVR